MSLPEDDRTVLSAGRQAPTGDHTQHRLHALPVGTRLSEFEILGVLGEGGFGIVYLAHDSTLDREVALKEYMPSFAWRATEVQVSVKSVQNADSFETGLRSFINEAQMLAQFDHPSLVKVYRFWEANGTAYMVMPYYRGSTLKKVLHERTAPPDETWLKALLGPLLDVLGVMHEHQCYHRDIAPDNILILDEGRPLLLDLGAARRAINGMNQAFTVIVKQNYAPIEQYAEMPGMSQGPWTDLYALASVLHFAIDGRPPPTALSRMMSDPYVPLTTRYAGRYSRDFLDAVDRALAFRPEGRPQDVLEMGRLLGVDPATSHEHVRTASAPIVPVPPPYGKDEGMLHGYGRFAVVIGGIVLGAAALFVYSGLRHREAGVATATAAIASAPVASPGPQAARSRSVGPIVHSAAALDAILASANPARQVTVQMTGTRVRIGKDNVGFSIRSAHAGYVYIYSIGTDRNDILLLFPNPRDKDNEIAAGKVMDLPRRTWPIRALGPAGTDHFVVMVSDMPRNFEAAGLTAGKPFAAFPVTGSAELPAGRPGQATPIAGVPECIAAPCSADYGAVAVAIEEVEN